MKRGLVIFGVILLVLAAGAGLGYWWLMKPVEPNALVEPGPSMESRQQASVVDTILAAYGVTDAAFIPSDDGAFVGYEASDAYGANETQFAALLALAQAAPEASTGVAVLHNDGVPTLAWSGDLDALRAAGDDGAALAAWIDSVEKTAL